MIIMKTEPSYNFNASLGELSSLVYVITWETLGYTIFLDHIHN